MAEFEHLEELTVGFYDRGTLAFSDFQWVLKSQRRSPIYYNQRPITSFHEGLNVNDREMTIEAQRRVCELAVTALSEGVDQLPKPHRHLHGIPQASTVLGGYVAQARGESYIWERVGQKDHGIKTKFEANFNPGDTVAVMDDVVTDGRSKIDTVISLHENDLEATGMVTMMDREEGGAAALEQEGIEFVPIIGLSVAVQVLLDNRRVDSQVVDWLNQYHEGLRADGINTTFKLD